MPQFTEISLEARADPAALDPVGPRNRIRPTWFFVLAFGVSWWLHHGLPFDIDGDGAGRLQQFVGTGLLAAGLTMTLWGLTTFARMRTGIMPDRPARQLVVSGPYRYSRNPMFLGFAGVYVGLAVVFNMAWPLLLLPVIVALLNVTVIRHEERYLEGLFGAAYRNYCGEVRRWV